MIKFCDFCSDGDGGTVFPYYGLAPHTHSSGIIGTTKFTGEIPENFSPDHEEQGGGIYTHCLNCGADGNED